MNHFNQNYETVFVVVLEAVKGDPVRPLNSAGTALVFVADVEYRLYHNI